MLWSSHSGQSSDVPDIALLLFFLRHDGHCQRLSEGQGKKKGNLNPRLVFLPVATAWKGNELSQ